MKTRTFLHLFAGAGVAALLGACSKAAPGPAFQAVDITGAEYAKDFHLPDAHGKTRSLSEFKGKVVAIFFGYTQCPDVCPTTLAEMAEIRNQLGADGDKLQTLFISVDPERDTPEILQAYMANFDASFIALRPENQEQLAAVAKDFKVYYKKVDGSAPGSYTMDHSAATYLYDPMGRLRLYAKYGGGSAPLLADIKLLMQQTA
ncbi:redoxin domain-containing protein [Xylophilus rhododendri]|uniref:Redoxin domain-containing protein n=1 Tax=Xylophilus rhododendri TaxID=2697032 RepID=A0A857J8L1_9BURK|nr:SCO family protein [Xylophilus rhododendri]QHI99411.1 redoxin domain-containing protein [Xylophilus rhododendri]